MSYSIVAVTRGVGGQHSGCCCIGMDAALENVTHNEVQLNAVYWSIVNVESHFLVHPLWCPELFLVFLPPCWKTFLTIVHCITTGLLVYAPFSPTICEPRTRIVPEFFKRIAGRTRGIFLLSPLLARAIGELNLDHLMTI